MFSGYGQAVNPERVAIYLQVLGEVTPERLKRAVEAAIRNTRGGFPPGPGDVAAELQHLGVPPSQSILRLPPPEMPEPGSERWMAEIEPIREQARRMGLLRAGSKGDRR